MANLSRFHQGVHLDLSEFKDLIPMELMGRAEFPPITQNPYFLTLGPHVAIWFSLVPSAGRDDSIESRSGEVLSLPPDWEEALQGDLRARLEAQLWAYLKRRTWF